MARQARRQRRRAIWQVTRNLVVLPILAGVMGTQLHNGLQWGAALLAVLTRLLV